jgi:hypothetical protein
VAAVRAVLKIDSQFQTLGRFSFFRHSHSQHPAAISSTFLLLRLFALFRGKSFLTSGRSTLFLWPQKKHKIHKKITDLSLFFVIPVTSYSPLVTFPSRRSRVARRRKAPLFLHFSFQPLRFQLLLHPPHATYCAPQFRLSPFAFLLLFIDIGSILNHPERYEKHYTRH